MDTDKGAILSPCGQYRYRLWRRWSSNVKPVAFIMLNPSTADAEQDDPTIRKCIGFAKRLGHGAIEVVNLYAYRATKPADLKRAGWPKGPENDRHILDACKDAAMVICAWGAHARGMERPSKVLDLLALAGIPTSALALTDDGQPRHPLMLGYDARPFAFGR